MEDLHELPDLPQDDAGWSVWGVLKTILNVLGAIRDIGNILSLFS